MNLHCAFLSGGRLLVPIHGNGDEPGQEGSNPRRQTDVTACHQRQERGVCISTPCKLNLSGLYTFTCVFRPGARPVSD